MHTLLLLLAGCLAPNAAKDAADVDPAAPLVKGPLMPVGPPLTGLHLARLSATSGNGVADVLDGDLHTGWRPSGALGASLRLSLDGPVTADTLSVSPCVASAPAGYDVEVNGSTIGPVGTEGEGVLVPLGAGGGGWRVADVELRITTDKPGVCLGEIQLLQRTVALPLRPPRTVIGSVRASSVLTPSEAHHPSLLFDHRLNFGWTEGKGGDGIGESVELTLREPFGLLGLELWNGDQGSSQRFAEGPRVAVLSVGADSGGRVSVPVRDEEGRQRIDLPKMMVGRTFQLGVQDVRVGAGSHDLSLSELRLVDLLGPVGVVLDGQDPRRAAILPRVRDTALETLLDQPLHSICGGRTLTLRTDLGFETELRAQADAADPARAEGDWTLAAGTMPWFNLMLFGESRVRTRGWVEPEDAVGGAPLPGDGAVSLAQIEDVGRAAFGTESLSWRGADRWLADCIGSRAKADGIDAFDLLVKTDAWLIRGALGPDVLTR